MARARRRIGTGPRKSGGCLVQLPGALVLAGVGALVGSFLLRSDLDRLEEYYRHVRPARATLKRTEVKEWIEGGRSWNAFGTFDVVAGDFRGEAVGSLKPSGFDRGRPRRYKVPRVEAEGFLADWEIGRTYDGYWPEEYPGHVFFEAADLDGYGRNILALRVACPVLILLGLLLGARVAPKADQA